MKFFRNFILVVVITFTAILMFNIFESKPFKFENFKTAEEAKEYLDEHYPLGTDINNILQDVSLAGATCIKRPTKIPRNQISIKIEGDYEKAYICEYWNNFISVDPLSMYIIVLYSDNNDKLIGIFIKKESKIEFP